MYYDPASMVTLFDGKDMTRVKMLSRENERRQIIENKRARISVKQLIS